MAGQAVTRTDLPANGEGYGSALRRSARKGYGMCGIVAMYSARGPIPADALGRATLRLGHRGPDGQRTWLSDDRRVGLGHARLSIIDLATGDQPIAGEDEAL